LKGYRTDEILGQHFSRFYSQDDVPAGVPVAALETATTHGRWESEGWRVRKDGSRFWADVVITALFDSDRVHRGFAKVTRDLTSRKRNEDALRGVLERERETATQLRELDRLRNEVVGVIAHDLRAPLGVVESLVHLLRVEWAERDDADKLDHLDRIRARLTTMSDLVDDVFDMATIESGQLEVERVEFEILKRAVSDVVVDPTARLVELRVGSGGRAFADPTRTVQVVSNLLSNALKYSPHDAPITVCVEQDETGVRISVTDRGVGVPAEDQERVFEPFTRLDRDHATGGTGLGLHIAKGLTEAQGGTLTLHSAPGLGSTFTITLPAATW
jgi:PAS domain S-box-containing protein